MFTIILFVLFIILVFYYGALGDKIDLLKLDNEELKKRLLILNER